MLVYFLEDSATQRKAMADALRAVAADLVVVEFATLAALESGLRGVTPCVILADLHLRDETDNWGTSLPVLKLEQVRPGLGGGVPVVLVSADLNEPNEALAARLRQQGAHAAVGKQDVELVARALRDAVASRAGARSPG